MLKCHEYEFLLNFPKSMLLRSEDNLRTPGLFSNKFNISIKCLLLVFYAFVSHFFMCSTVHYCHSSLTSSLTVSLAPLVSQFCWTALALSPSRSSAPAELCPPRLPSSRHRTRPWTPRPQRSPSQSWRTNCCSPNRTPHLIKSNSVAQTATIQLASVLIQSTVIQTWCYGVRDFLISIGYVKPDKILLLHFTPICSVYIHFHMSPKIFYVQPLAVRNTF